MSRKLYFIDAYNNCNRYTLFVLDDNYRIKITTIYAHLYYTNIVSQLF
jgi:hypothetical protein